MLITDSEKTKMVEALIDGGVDRAIRYGRLKYCKGLLDGAIVGACTVVDCWLVWCAYEIHKKSKKNEES